MDFQAWKHSMLGVFVCVFFFCWLWHILSCCAINTDNSLSSKWPGSCALLHLHLFDCLMWVYFICISCPACSGNHLCVLQKFWWRLGNMQIDCTQWSGRLYCFFLRSFYISVFNEQSNFLIAKLPQERSELFKGLMWRTVSFQDRERQVF